jgi:hypothetical protein
MFEHGVVRYRWLKLMYSLTIIFAGITGLLMVLSPSTINSLMSMPTENPMIFGLAGSLWLAIGLLSVLGLRSPLKFVPVLLLELIYKTVWIVFVVLPAFVNNSYSTWVTPIVVLFLAFMVGEIIAIPFWTLFEKDEVGTRRKAEPIKAM